MIHAEHFISSSKVIILSNLALLITNNERNRYSFTVGSRVNKSVVALQAF